MADLIGDYDDDTHFCLKCHSTIIGLDNYVSHRKSGCAKTVDLPKSPLPSQLLPPDESFTLKADDFFSSLELQSSSKKLPQSGGKNFSGILTRSKTTAAIQASTSSQKDHEIPQSKSGKNVWIGGHQLKLGYGDNETKLIKAVDNLERRKEEPPEVDVYEDSDVESEDFDFDVDESSEEENHDGPPRHHTGGKWKPSSPIQWNRPHDWTSVPPPNYTGAKWKPTAKRASPPPTHTKGKWKPSYASPDREEYFPPPTFTGSKWSQSKARQEYEAPPASHTKGKWKPDEEEQSPRAKTKTRRMSPSYTSGKWKPPNLSQPSPSYTKGKWLPGEDSKKTKITNDSPFRKSSGTVQYWCRPCNRRLASKIVYERHLKSELHFKRTLNDKEFDDSFGIIPEKRSKRKINIDETLHTSPIKCDIVKTRKRKTIYIKCEVCKSRVNRNMMGKHLISHYHCRKADISSDVAKAMVLDNIGEIIFQSPFQCGVCKFYFNHQKDFLQHWLSNEHSRKEKTCEGYFYCSLCKFSHKDSGIVYEHLISDEHEEVVSVINRSVPIVIKKITSFKCDECDEEFMLNIALLRHCQISGHKSANLSSNINNFICGKCKQIFRSNVSLKRHRQNVHGENVYICTVCNQNFQSKNEALKHRNGSDHRQRVALKGGVKARKCDYCSEVFGNITSFKQHLKSVHSEYNPKCLRCGAVFSLPQELTVHLRTKSCSFSETLDATNFCDKCPFSSNSTSELIYHKVLHTEPLLLPVDDSHKKPSAQYKCPLCQRFFPKLSLQAHLRLHTKERPFICKICKKDFARKNNWMLHVRNHNKRDEKMLTSTLTKAKDIGDRPFLCSTCGASFKKKAVLQQHMTIHSGKLCKCPEVGCVFSARNMGDLKRHFATHSEAKSFSCNMCEYRGKTKQQLKRHSTIHTATKNYSCPKCSFTARTMSHLKRHSRLHTGSKPYNCPHCDYKCNNLENLRKHILSTNKHRGKCIYECKFCQHQSPFQSNFAKEFKAHLVTKHPSIFKTGREAASYVAGIYDAQDDCTSIPDTVTDNNEEHDKNGPKIVVVDKEATVSDEGIFPMFIVSKDGGAAENWSVVGNYDVEESGALVPFNTDNVLFQTPF